jgi:hypothetical protein
LDDTTPAGAAAGSSPADRGAATTGTATAAIADPSHTDTEAAGAGAAAKTGAVAGHTGAAGHGAVGTGGAQAGDAPAGGGKGDTTKRGGAAPVPAPEPGTGGAAARPSGAGGRHGTDDGHHPVPERESPRRVGLGGVLRSSLGPALERLPAPWRDSLRGALTEQVPTLAGRLAALPAQAARGTRPAWWTVLGVLQWVCGAAAVVGAAWLIAATVSAAVPDPALAALWLLAGGVLVGVLASLVALPLVRRAARAERAALDAALRSAVAAAARDCVQGPVEAELTAYRTAHTALATARGRR